MNSYVFQFLVVLISSGTLGTIVTALSKKRERENTSNIEKIVKTETLEIRNSMLKVTDNQKSMASELEKIVSKIDKLQEMQDKIEEKFIKFKKESEDLDLFMVSKLRQKKVFNGESDEFYKKLLSYKEEQEDKKEKK